MQQYRVVNLATNGEINVNAITPELAGLATFGETLVRSGQRRDLRAKVYWRNSYQELTMCRLYSQVDKP